MNISCNTLLLIGPTGCGKTPFGQHLEQHGLLGRRAAHFDFGEHLRGAAAHPSRYPLLDAEDIAAIQHSIRTGALLTDEQFPIAEKVLQSFVASQPLIPDGWLVLNGLPRHVGQAVALSRLLRMAGIAYLECEDHVVAERIATNAGGDRTGRLDDGSDDVRVKLAIFKSQTMALLDYYRVREVPVIRIPVTTTSTPEGHRLALENALRDKKEGHPGGSAPTSIHKKSRLTPS